ncbi:MAG TPA: hypothetical protein VGC67_13815 [Cellulomonas sp.]
MRDKQSTWYIGAALIAVVMLAFTWFIAVSPTLSSASAASDEAQSVRDGNEVLQANLTALKEDYANLDDLKAQVAAKQVGIPTELDLEDFLRELDGFLSSRSMTALTITPSDPQVVPLTADETTTDSATAEATASATTSTDSTTTSSSDSGAALDGFVAVPISITVLGSYPNALLLLSDLQTTATRHLLITGLIGTGQDDAEASGGRPATSAGDVELQISGYLYVLTETTDGDAATDDSSSAALPDGDTSQDSLAPSS